MLSQPNCAPVGYEITYHIFICQLFFHQKLYPSTFATVKLFHCIVYSCDVEELASGEKAKKDQPIHRQS